MGGRGVGDAVGAAAEFSQAAPSHEGGQSLLTDTADLGLGGVVPTLPPLEPTAAERETAAPVSAVSVGDSDPCSRTASARSFAPGTTPLTIQGSPFSSTMSYTSDTVRTGRGPTAPPADRGPGPGRAEENAEPHRTPTPHRRPRTNSSGKDGNAAGPAEAEPLLAGHVKELERFEFPCPAQWSDIQGAQACRGDD